MATTRKPATRRPAATKTAAPIVLDETSGPDKFAEREPLFSLRGQEYTIPVRVPAGVALEYTLRGVEGGLDAAIAFALTYALGDEGRRALTSYRDLTPEQLGRIILAVRAKFDGAMEGPKAPPTTG